MLTTSQGKLSPYFLEDGTPQLLPLSTAETPLIFSPDSNSNTILKDKPESNNKLSKFKSLNWAKPKLNSSHLKETGTIKPSK